MKELALYILDLAENSIAAGAKNITIDVHVNSARDELFIRISDDGKGMDPDFVRSVTNPFVTTRTQRRLGLGLPLFQDLVRQCEGTLNIVSEKGKGTIIEAKMKRSSVDMVPIGDMGASIVSMIISNPALDIVYSFVLDDYSFVFDTKLIRETLKDVSITEPAVLSWIAGYVNEGTKEIIFDVTKNINKNRGGIQAL
ncbi:ATP-binding protein [Coprothermobacter platensis]|uniref:ATP-binding protein n=1 Tax=Coprothermobacter platensis TaxID=108819 RepID=UPI0003A3621C|nr:ATP-binding protein [Coprothermobacter platensis]